MEGNIAAKFLAEMTGGPRTIRIHNALCTGYQYTDSRPHPCDVNANLDAEYQPRIISVAITFEDSGVRLKTTILAEAVSYEEH